MVAPAAPSRENGPVGPVACEALRLVQVLRSLVLGAGGASHEVLKDPSRAQRVSNLLDEVVEELLSPTGGEGEGGSPAACAGEAGAEALSGGRALSSCTCASRSLFTGSSAAKGGQGAGGQGEEEEAAEGRDPCAAALPFSSPPSEQVGVCCQCSCCHSFVRHRPLTPRCDPSPSLQPNPVSSAGAAEHLAGQRHCGLHRRARPNTTFPPPTRCSLLGLPHLVRHRKPGPLLAAHC